MDNMFESLELRIKGLTQEEKIFLATKMRASEIEMFFSNMKEVIAQEAKLRVQSKIVLTFNKGYGHGSLFNSIYYKIEGNDISISSTKSYFAILNAGFKSFDMKDALLGKTVKMRLPGGRVIFRKVGAPGKTNPRKNRKVSPLNHNWIHPGFKGANIYAAVNDEMQPWIANYVAAQMESLFRLAKGRLSDIYGVSGSGKQYYNVRNNGRFTKSVDINLQPSELSKLLAEDVKRYRQQGPSGLYSPFRKNDL